MKNLVEIINESKSKFKYVEEGSAFNDGLHVECYDMSSERGKKYGFLSYDRNSDCAFLEAFDSIDDLINEYGEITYFEELVKVQVNETYRGEDDSLWLRIW